VLSEFQVFDAGGHMIAYQKEDGRVSVPEKNAPIGKRLLKKHMFLLIHF